MIPIVNFITKNMGFMLGNFKKKDLDKIYDKRVFLTDRLIYWDLLKGISIVLVVFGHSIQYGSGQAFYIKESFFEDVVFQTIYSFHMPLLMTVSGYLLSFSVKKYNFSGIITRKINSLLIPIFAWGIISKIHETIVYRQDYSIKWLASCLKYCITNIWFLWAVLIWSICIICIETFINRKVYKFFIITSFYLALFFIPEPRSLVWMANINIYIHSLLYHIWEENIKNQQSRN